MFNCKYVYHENGLRIIDEKLGCFFLFFKDMKFIRITKTLKNQWLVASYERNIIFNSLSGKNIIALEFTGNALPEVLFKIKDDFDKNGVKYSYFEQTPAIFEES